MPNGSILGLKRKVLIKQVADKAIALSAHKSQLTLKRPKKTSTRSKRAAAAKPIVRIGTLIHDVARIRKTLFDQAVKDVGITRAQWWALSNISRNGPDGMSQSDLARYLEVGKPAVSGLIDRLVVSGMIERHADDYDRRVHLIFITDYGYDVIQQMSPIAVSLNQIFLHGISEKDIQNVERVLDKMKHNFRDLFGSGPDLKLPVRLKPSLLRGKSDSSDAR